MPMEREQQQIINTIKELPEEKLATERESF